MLSLDDLPVVAAATEQPPAKRRKPTKVDAEAEAEYGRAMAIRSASMEFRLVSLLRYYTLDQVIEYWWKAQATD